MRNITKTLLALLLLFFIGSVVISCSQESTIDSIMSNGAKTTGSDNSDSGDENPEEDLPYVQITYFDPNSKVASSDYKYDVPSGNVTDEEVSAIKSLMDGKRVFGLSFVGITEITGIFDDALFIDELDELKFDGALTSIGNHCFENQVNVLDIEFTGDILPQVQEHSFPWWDAFVSSGEAIFKVPKELAAQTLDVFMNFIGDQGRLNIPVYITLDPNIDYEDEFQIEISPETATRIQVYVGDSINISNSTALPQVQGEASFDGFYTKPDLGDRGELVIDHNGYSMYSVDGYTNDISRWINVTEEVTLYAHYTEWI